MAFDHERAWEIASRIAASLGLEVVEVELRGAGKNRMLRVFIDKPGTAADTVVGVTHEDCANFSREFGTVLDVENVAPDGSYVLEVSSPGLDRKLSRPADFERFRGSLMKVMTRDPVGGNRHFVGRLEAFQGGRLTLDLATAKNPSRPEQHATVEIELGNVERANLVPEF